MRRRLEATKDHTDHVPSTLTCREDAGGPTPARKERRDAGCNPRRGCQAELRLELDELFREGARRMLAFRVVCAAVDGGGWALTVG